MGNDITSVRLCYEIIPCVDHANFLTIYIDELLECYYHIDHISKNIYSGIFAFNSAQNYVSWKHEILVFLFCSLLFIAWNNDL